MFYYISLQVEACLNISKTILEQHLRYCLSIFFVFDNMENRHLKVLLEAIVF